MTPRGESDSSNPASSLSQPDKWRQWAVAAQQGDQRAYASLLKEIAKYIRNVLVGGLANADWADDITQEVLISVHKSLKTYSADRPFKPWLMAIVNFRRTDFLRKHYSSKSDMQTDLEDNSFQKTHVTESVFVGELKDVEKALDKLPDKQRRAFEMMRIEGHTASEVAKTMGMSVSAVKVSVHRAQKILNKMREQV